MDFQERSKRSKFNKLLDILNNLEKFFKQSDDANAKGRYNLVQGVVSNDDGAAASRCLACQAGRFNAVEGSSLTSACQLCPKGTWLLKTNDDNPGLNAGSAR